MWRFVQYCTAIFGAILLTQVLSWISGYIFQDHYPEVPGAQRILVDRETLQRGWPHGLDDFDSRAKLRAHMRSVEHLTPPPVDASLTTAAPAEPEPDLGTLLANADVENGERRARACVACHTFNEGGSDGQGPNLWGVLGRDIAARDSFNYSTAMAEEEGVWTIEKINEYLKRPANAVPGNRMAFAGIRRAKDRADVIAYLRQHGSSGVPLPEPAPAEPEQEAELTESH